MKFAPKVAVTLALVSAFSTPFVRAEDEAPAVAPPIPDIRLVIDQKLGELDRRAKQAVIEGQLSQEEADNFRSALGQIAEDEAAYISFAGKLGPVEAARLRLATDRLQKRFFTTLHDRRIAAVDLDRQIDDASAIFAAAQTEGRLDASQAAQLQAELKAIKDLGVSLASDGFVSYGDGLVLSMRVDRLFSHFGKLLDDPKLVGVPSATEVAAQANTLIETGSALRKQYDDLMAQLTKNANTSSPELKAQQDLYLASQFELLKAKAADAKAGRTAEDVTVRIAEVNKAITNDFVFGKLTPAEAHELDAELTSVANELKSATTAEAQQRAALEVERVAGLANRWLHSPKKMWAGMDPFQAAFDHRLEESLRAGRITAEQAATYREAADKIAKQEAASRESEGGLNLDEALDVAMQMERLAVQLHHDKKDRNVTVPDIDALQKRLDQSIAEAIESGKMPLTAVNWNERLSHIAELRSNYEKTPGGLDARARLAIADSIERELAEVQAAVHRDLPADPSLDLQLDHLGDLVSNAVATGLLSIERGAQYRAGVDTIYGQLSTDRKSATGITAAQSAAIASDIALLESQLIEELRDSAVFAPLIAEKLTDLEVRIGRALSDGRLTVGQANELMLEVDRKLSALSTAAGAQGGLSLGEGLRLVYDARLLHEKFESYLHENPVPMTDVAQRAIMIDSTLANALAAGQLNVSQSQQFKNSLEKVLTNSVVYRESDGSLSYPESIALAIELDQIAGNINSDLAKNSTHHDVDTREAELKNRIAALIANGKMTTKDADQLRNDLDRIEASEAAFRVSDEGLNYAEALTLMLDLDRLSTRLDSLGKGAAVTSVQQPKSR